MAVTNAQVQASFDQDIRPIANASLLLLEHAERFIGSRDDLYNGIDATDWEDSRADAPPHMAAKADWGSANTFIDSLYSIVTGSGGDAAAKAALVDALRGQYPVIRKLATRSGLMQ